MSSLGFNYDNVQSGYNDEIRCACPVHDGDNPTAFCYSINHKSWRCYTNHCEEGNFTIFGLVKKLLAKQYGREVSFRESVVWLANLLSIPIDAEGEQSPESLEIFKLVNQAKIKSKIKNGTNIRTKESSSYPFPLWKIDKKIEPSWYFLEQGFSREILTKYNVGYCDNPSKRMYLRSFVPILDEKGKNVIGVTGRTIYNKCEFCPLFHEEGKGCPKDNYQVRGFTKWLHDGFNTGSVLYNSWFAEPYVKKSGVAVLTEGTKEVWWFEQHGLHNSMCIFGLNILKYHLARLINMDVTTLVVGLDNDQRGLEAMEKINNTFDNYFKIVNINHLLSSQQDIDEISTERMNREIVPYINSLSIRK